MAKVIFSYNGTELTIQCTKDDKMKDICKRFSTKVDINMNSLFFLYGGNKINYELTFMEQANSNDNNCNQMKVLVYKKDNEELKCKKCGSIINLSILDNIIKYNNEQRDIIIEMKSQINNIINLNNINEITRKIKIVKLMLDNLIAENEKCLKEIQNTRNNNENITKKNYNFELAKKHGLNSYEENILKNLIVKSVEQCSSYFDIATSIKNYCEKWKEGIWSVIVGEKDKYIIFSEYNSCIAGYIGPYKIKIDYISSLDNV